MNTTATSPEMGIQSTPAFATETMKVTVVDRASMDKLWGHGLYQVLCRTVVISNRCPQCHGPRGMPQSRHFFEDGCSYSADVWTNPCGHLDKYEDVLREAAALVDSAR